MHASGEVGGGAPHTVVFVGSDLADTDDLRQALVLGGGRGLTARTDRSGSLAISSGIFRTGALASPRGSRSSSTSLPSTVAAHGGGGGTAVAGKDSGTYPLHGSNSILCEGWVTSPPPPSRRLSLSFFFLGYRFSFFQIFLTYFFSSSFEIHLRIIFLFRVGEKV